MFHRCSLALCLALSPLVAACATPQIETGTNPPPTTNNVVGGGSGTVHDVGGAPSPLPQMPANGGPIMSQPNIVTIVFDDDPDAQSMLDFGDWAVSSVAWLGAFAGDYGIGPGTSLGMYMNAVNATVTDSDVQSWMTSGINSGNLPPPSDPSAPTLYVWLLGPGAKMTDSDGSCTGGYHAEMTINGQQVPYAVVPTCPTTTYKNLTALQYREGRASHELAEAFTDPFPSSAPGYIFESNSLLWTSTYGEVGDVCVWNYLPFTAPSGETFTAQRIWSNSAAALGGDPCVPRPDGLAYFNVNATPAFPTAHPGDAVTFTLTGWTAEAAHAAWPIWWGPSAWQDFAVSPVLSGSKIGDGGQVTLTMQVPTTATAGQHVSGTIISDDGTTNSIWPIAIQVAQ